MTTGIEAIAAERKRQIEVHGYDSKHDSGHHPNQFIDAASCYQAVAWAQNNRSYKPQDNAPFMWPWDAESWKPSENPRRNLEKAGALIAAAIDRLDAEE
ncbi:hypothetical protein [Carnimonas bestiolae]|uniref:hypothetical protein n=1 Tax=Carnimonas bestiolae TaxID=3402172 RepID=UPI003EDC5AE8